MKNKHLQAKRSSRTLSKNGKYNFFCFPVYGTSFLPDYGKWGVFFVLRTRTRFMRLFQEKSGVGNTNHGEILFYRALGSAQDGGGTFILPDGYGPDGWGTD